MLQNTKAGVIMQIADLETEHPNDQEFMSAIFKQFERLMYTTARKYIPDTLVAEDLIQDTIVKLIPKIDTLRKLSRNALSSYIVISIKRTSLNYLHHEEVSKRNVHIESLDDTDPSVQDPDFSLDDIIIQRERRAEFLRVWVLLLEKDRDLLMGKYILGLDDRELAEMCRCKPKSIRMLLTRARRRALAKMEQEAAFSYDEA